MQPNNEVPEGFDAPWQAEAYALGQALVAAGLVAADDWARALNTALRRKLDDEKLPDNAETYSSAVVDALCTVTRNSGIVSSEELSIRTEAWRSAYKTTAHGKPVKLG